MPVVLAFDLAELGADYRTRREGENEVIVCAV